MAKPLIQPRYDQSLHFRVGLAMSSALKQLAMRLDIRTTTLIRQALDTELERLKTNQVNVNELDVSKRTKPINLYVTKTVKQQIKTEATHYGLSISDLVRVLLNRYLKSEFEKSY